MESAGLRSRQKSSTDSQKVALSSSRSKESGTRRARSWVPREPPTYTINLSLPPRERYKQVAEDFKNEVVTLPFLFDEVVKGHLPTVNPGRVRKLAKLLLRRVHNEEENEELVGIYEITGIDMYLLVAFNVLLDLFMGCTSGGVKVRDGEEATRMLHFRTLDWGMPALRKVIVQLDFIERSGGPVVASSVTYAGYVGVLTGVRKGLSMSLNFRPTHDASTKWKNFRFYLNHLLVLLGRRPSISSVLRQCLLPTTNDSRRFAANLESIERYIPVTKSTAAYLIYSDGKRTIAMEKDLYKADVRSSPDFIITTNHDVSEEVKPVAEKQHSNGNTTDRVQDATGMEILVEESTDRKACMVEFYRNAIEGRNEEVDRARRTAGAVDQSEVIMWMKQYPITNEETHYATLMDPTTGTVAWKVMYPKEMTTKKVKIAWGD